MLILQARVAAGWIDASELPQPEPEYEEEYAEGEYGEGEYDPEAVFAPAEAVDGDSEASNEAADEPEDA
jgi:N utilization substance protein A